MDTQSVQIFFDKKNCTNSANDNINIVSAKIVPKYFLTSVTNTTGFLVHVTRALFLSYNKISPLQVLQAICRIRSLFFYTCHYLQLSDY